MTGESSPKRRGIKCGANKRQGDGNCRRPAGWGTSHPGYGTCKLHGGSTRASTRHAEVELAKDAVATYGLPVQVDPGEALVDEVHRTYGHVLWLLERVREVSPDALVWGQADEVDKQATEFPGVDRTYQAKPNVWLDLYGKERDRLIAVTTAALKAGIDERRLRLSERDAAAAVEAVARALDDDQAQLTDGQRQALRQAIAREFRKLSPGGQT